MPAADRPPDDDFGGFWVRIRPLESPRGIPSSRRVRSWLKCGLRSYMLRVERVSRIGPDGSDAEAPTHPPVAPAAAVTCEASADHEPSIGQKPGRSPP
jgi:hypothetical protein